MVVVAKPGGVPLAGRARLRPVHAGLRVRRAAIPDVRLPVPDGYGQVGVQCPDRFEGEVTANPASTSALTVVDVHAPGPAIGESELRGTVYHEKVIRTWRLRIVGVSGWWLSAEPAG